MRNRFVASVESSLGDVPYLSSSRISVKQHREGFPMKHSDAQVRSCFRDEESNKTVSECVICLFLRVKGLGIRRNLFIPLQWFRKRKTLDTLSSKTNPLNPEKGIWVPRW